MNNRLFAVAATVGWVGAIFAAPAGPPAEPPRAGGDAPLRLEARPSSVQWSSSVSFDAEGNVTHEQSDLSVNLFVYYDPRDRPMAYDDVKLHRVVTSSGEELLFDPDRNRRGSQTIHTNRHQEGRPSFNTYFNLPIPEQPCESIRLIEGELTLTLPHGEVKQITLVPWSKFEDKRVRVTNVPGSLVVLRRQDEGRVRVEYDRAMEPLITEVLFVDGAGTPIEADRRGGGGSGMMAYRYYAVDMPEDGGVWLRLYPETRRREAVFVARDVPVPGQAGGKKAFDLVVEAVGLNQAKAGPQPEALEVEIIGEAE